MLGVLPRLTDVVGSMELILLAVAVVVTVAAVVAAGVALEVVAEASFWSSSFR